MKRFISWLFIVFIGYTGGCLSQGMFAPELAEQAPRGRQTTITTDVIRARHIQLIDENGRKQGELLAFQNAEYNEVGAVLCLGMRHLDDPTGEGKCACLRAAHSFFGFDTSFRMGDSHREGINLQHVAQIGDSGASSPSFLQMESYAVRESIELNTWRMGMDKLVGAIFSVDAYKAHLRGNRKLAVVGFDNEQHPAVLYLSSKEGDRGGHISLAVPYSAEETPVVILTDHEGKETTLMGK